MKKVGIIIPIANEEGTVLGFLRAVLSAISALPYEWTVFVIMDNYSKDATQSIVEKLEKEDSRIKLVFYKEARGVVSCHFEGMRRALADNCDYIIEMDSGWSHPPERLKDLMQVLDEEGYEAVFMSRFKKGGALKNLPYYRTVVGRGGTLLANLWLGTRYTDGPSGFEGFQAHVLRSLNFDAFLSKGGIYGIEMKYYVSDFKWKELPFVYVGSTTDFKFVWLWIALKVLYKMKWNKPHALRVH